MFAFCLAAALSSCFYGRSSCTLKIHFLNRKTFLSAADESRSDVVLQQCRSSRFCLNMFVTVGFIVLLLLYENMSRAENHFRFFFFSLLSYICCRTGSSWDWCVCLALCLFLYQPGSDGLKNLWKSPLVSKQNDLIRCVLTSFPFLFLFLDICLHTHCWRVLAVFDVLLWFAVRW